MEQALVSGAWRSSEGYHNMIPVQALLKQGDANWIDEGPVHGIQVMIEHASHTTDTHGKGREQGCH